MIQKTEKTTQLQKVGEEEKEEVMLELYFKRQAWVAPEKSKGTYSRHREQNCGKPPRHGKAKGTPGGWRLLCGRDGEEQKDCMPCYFVDP